MFYRSIRRLAGKRTIWLVLGVLVVLAGGYTRTLVLGSDASSTNDTSSADRSGQPLSELDAEVAQCSGAVTEAVDDGYVNYGNALALGHDMMLYCGIQSPRYKAFNEAAGWFQQNAVQHGYEAVGLELLKRATAVCRKHVTAAMQQTTPPETAPPAFPEPAPPADRQAESTDNSEEPPVDPAVVQECSEEVERLIRAVADGSMPIDDAKLQLPEVIPPAALDSAVEGVTTYMESDGLSFEDAVAHTVAYEAGRIDGFCRMPR